jgi:hypothetical protein
MNILEYAAANEMCFEQFLESVGKTRKTTFFSDLTIAECYGMSEVVDTYNRVMDDWSKNLDFMCEWVIALNQKIWQHYKDNPGLAQKYDELWRKADEHCMKVFKGEKLTAYLNYVD